MRLMAAEAGPRHSTETAIGFAIPGRACFMDELCYTHPGQAEPNAPGTNKNREMPRCQMKSCAGSPR
jgi:hypothetical protein